MITGIGTPNSHNRIPRPIISSSNEYEEETQHGVAGSCAKTVLRDGTFCDLRIFGSNAWGSE
jgi:hypothetical protein